MKKTIVQEPQLNELVDLAVQNFWMRVLPSEGAEKPWLYYPSDKGYSGASYRDISAQAHCVAAYLMRRGVKKGEVVAVIADQSPFYLAVDLGLQFLGAVNLTLSDSISREDLAGLVEKPGIRFIFIQMESVFLGLDQLREMKNSLKEIVLLCDEVDDLDPDNIFTYDTIVNHGKIAWREFADQLRVMKSAVVPTDVYSMQFRKEFRKLVSVSFGDFLKSLDEALAYYSSSKFNKIISMQSPESILERSFGLYAPMLLNIQAYCFPQGTNQLNSRIIAIKPECLIASPESLTRLEEETVETNLTVDGRTRKRLLNSMVLCDKRLKFIKEGKKPPIFVRIQHFLLRKTLFKKIAKLFGNKLKEIVCDTGPLDQKTYAFFSNAGFSILRPGKEG